MFVLAVLGEARAQYVRCELPLVVQCREKVPQDPEVSAVFLSTLLDELYQGDEITVLGEEALEGEQELGQWLHKCRGVCWLAHALDLVVGKNDDFDDELAK